MNVHFTLFFSLFLLTARPPAAEARASAPPSSNTDLLMCGGESLAEKLLAEKRGSAFERIPKSGIEVDRVVDEKLETFRSARRESDPRLSERLSVSYSLHFTTPSGRVLTYQTYDLVCGREAKIADRESDYFIRDPDPSHGFKDCSVNPRSERLIVWKERLDANGDWVAGACNIVRTHAKGRRSKSFWRILDESGQMIFDGHAPLERRPLFQ